MKNQLQKVLSKINKLNDKIDNKIINGLPYKKEAIEHKNLVAYYKDLKKMYA